MAAAEAVKVKTWRIFNDNYLRCEKEDLFHTRDASTTYIIWYLPGRRGRGGAAVMMIVIDPFVIESHCIALPL